MSYRALRGADPGRAARRAPSGSSSPATQVEPGQAAPRAVPHRGRGCSASTRPDCLAIEDSNTGARSAEAAGCTVLVVQNHVPVLTGERRVFRDTLVGTHPGNLPERAR